MVFKKILYHIVIFTLFPILLSSCIDPSIEVYDEWICYKIKKDKHRSREYSEFIFAQKKIDVTESQVYFKANLSASIYDTLSLGIDKYDWNKLYGITSYKIHKDSYRIGFRLLNGRWEFSAYWYDDGVRHYKYLGSCSLFDVPYFYIDVRDDNKVTFHMEGNKTLTFDIKEKPKHFYRAYSYFGGNQKAPNNIKICIFELDKK